MCIIGPDLRDILTQPGPTLQIQRSAFTLSPSNLRPKTCRCTRDRAGPWPSLSSMARVGRARGRAKGPRTLELNIDTEKLQEVQEIGPLCIYTYIYICIYIYT